ncbi:hypothetical protein D3C80_1419930 [compost metagenome]
MSQAEGPLAPGSGEGSPPDLTDYPVREYVAGMAGELASMARWDGDEKLAEALEAAADMARQAAPAAS